MSTLLLSLFVLQTPDQDILQLISDSQAAHSALGVLGLAGALVYGLVRIYRARLSIYIHLNRSSLG